MAEEVDQMEIERVRNIVNGFGWRITKQELLTDRIVLTVEKNRTASAETEAGSPG